MENTFNLKKFLAEGKLLKESLNEDLSYLASWKVLKGPGGYIFQIQGPNRDTIGARVNKAGMATLDGEGAGAAQAVQQIADQFGTETEVLYGDDSLTTVISEPDFNAIFPDTISEGIKKSLNENSVSSLINNIPNEKYFYLADEEADFWFNPEEVGSDYNWTEFDWSNDGDLVDYFYDDIFNNELKGKPGVEGNNFNEWQDSEREKSNKPVGPNVTLLVNKIKSIITDYKKLNFSNQGGGKASQIKTLIQQEYPEIIQSGEIETGTEEWLFLLQLALKVYGLNIPNEYDILKAIDGKGPYAKQIANLNYKYSSDLEQALEELGVKVY